MFTTDSLANNFSLPLFCLPKKLTWRVVYNLTGVAVAQEVPGSSCSCPCVSLSKTLNPKLLPTGRPLPCMAAHPPSVNELQSTLSVKVKKCYINAVHLPFTIVWLLMFLDLSDFSDLNHWFDAYKNVTDRNYNQNYRKSPKLWWIRIIILRRRRGGKF